MSNSRQLDAGILVRSFGVTFSAKTLAPPRSETWDQLVYAVRGALTVKANDGTWFVPPHRAVWLPSNTPYKLEMSGETALRMIYLRKARRAKAPAGFDPGRCAVVSVSPLLRELILRTVQIGALTAKSPHHCRLAGLIEDEIRTIGTVPLQLPYPQSATARRFAESLESEFGPLFDLDRALRTSGSSRRTMERAFGSETGMSLGQWVRRRKLLHGLERMLAGDTVAAVAFELAYSTPSAFIAMFKRELGSSPGEYLAGD